MLIKLGESMENLVLLIVIFVVAIIIAIKSATFLMLVLLKPVLTKLVKFVLMVLRKEPLDIDFVILI